MDKRTLVLHEYKKEHRVELAKEYEEEIRKEYKPIEITQRGRSVVNEDDLITRMTKLAAL